MPENNDEAEFWRQDADRLNALGDLVADKIRVTADIATVLNEHMQASGDPEKWLALFCAALDTTRDVDSAMRIACTLCVESSSG